ncbi:uncharacterized protein LOC134479308 [Rattus norvegicus]|uniref:uncharacterized protein LOC134479308 n=1 Tax=Rattus norvegicus TaxID=10116 RepID=UPI002FD80057
MPQLEQIPVISSVNTQCLHHLTSSPDFFASSYHCLYPHLPLLHISQRSLPLPESLKSCNVHPNKRDLDNRTFAWSPSSLHPHFGPQVESLFGTLNNWVPAGGDKWRPNTGTPKQGRLQDDGDKRAAAGIKDSSGRIARASLEKEDATGVCQLPEWLVRLADPGSMKIQLSWFGSLESFLCPWRNMEDSHSSFVITEILALLQSLCPVPPRPALRPSVHCCLVEAAVDWGTLPWFCRSQTWSHCLLVVPEKNDRS